MADDAEIRRLITAAHIVTEKLSLTSTASDMQELVPKFRVIIVCFQCFFRVQTLLRFQFQGLQHLQIPLPKHM